MSLEHVWAYRSPFRSTAPISIIPAYFLLCRPSDSSVVRPMFPPFAQDGSNGFCVPSGDEDGYEEGLRKLVQDKDLRNKVLPKHCLLLLPFRFKQGRNETGPPVVQVSLGVTRRRRRALLLYSRGFYLWCGAIHPCWCLFRDSDLKTCVRVVLCCRCLETHTHAGMRVLHIGLFTQTSSAPRPLPRAKPLHNNRKIQLGG